MVAALALVAIAGGRVTTMAAPQPAYQIELDVKPFQIRRYPTLLDATVRVTGSRDAAVSSGFRILANYIFGGNASDTKIAMTAPVLQTPADTPTPRRLPDKAARAPDAPASGPDSPTGNPRDWQVTFIMPAPYTLQSLPAANDPRIQFAEVPAGRMAVVTFSGWWTESNILSHQQALVGFLHERHLQPISGPIYAFYDPPWIPWFMRTNEVQFRLAPAPGPP
jgi:hypothetical protein